MLGESLSESLGLSWSEVQWLSSQAVLGVVGSVECLQAGSVLECSLQLSSVLLVDDGQVSGDGLSDKLLLDCAQNNAEIISTQ